MLRIGMIGADNFHALAFSKLANLAVEQGGSGLSVQVTMLWGESPERAAFVAKEANIATVVQTPQEMLGQVDAVMVVLRKGSQHYAAALPFVQAGVPTWVDKPFTIEVDEAVQLVQAAQASGAMLVGGSTCKYCPDVLALQQAFKELCGQGSIISAGFNFPGELDSPYDGLYFYAGHAVEILLTVFGSNLQSVRADVTANNVIAVFKYPDLAVSVNFAQVSQFYATLYSLQEVVVRQIDISTIYRNGFDVFVQNLLGTAQPAPYENLLRPVQVLNALVQAVSSGRETRVAERISLGVCVDKKQGML